MYLFCRLGALRPHLDAKAIEELIEREAEQARRRLGELAEGRELRRVTLKDFPVSGRRAGALLYDGEIAISSRLSGPQLTAVVRREAFLLSVPSAVMNLQITVDLGWLHAWEMEKNGRTREALREWWSICYRGHKTRMGALYAPAYLLPWMTAAYNDRGSVELLKRINDEAREGRVVREEELYYVVVDTLQDAIVQLSEDELSKAIDLLSGEASEEEKSKNRFKVARRKLLRYGIYTKGSVVNIHRLGLQTMFLVISGLRQEALHELADLPVVYRILEGEVSLEDHVVVFIVGERDVKGLKKSIEEASEARGFKFELHRARAGWHMLQRRMYGKQSEAYMYLKKALEQGASNQAFGVRVGKLNPPSIQVDKVDLKILRLIHRIGKTSNRKIRALAGVSKAETERRLRKLRNQGLVLEYWGLTGLGVGAPTFLLVEAKELYDAYRICSALSEVSTVMGSWCDSGVLACICYTPSSMLTYFTRAVKEALGDKLLKRILLREAGPSGWDIPVEYWREDVKSFDFSGVMEQVRSILAGSSGDAYSRVVGSTCRAALSKA